MSGMNERGKPQRILIVGAGAVGLFYGSRLHQPKNNVLVSLVCRSNYNAIKANGVKLETHSFGNYAFHPENVFNSVQQASDFLQTTGGEQSSCWDYVVVTTKALPTSDTSNSQANLIRPVVSKGTTIVLIQNGIGIEKPYADVFLRNALLSAVTVVSAEQLEQGFVRQNRWTRISLGPWDSAGSKQGEERMREFTEIMKNGGVKDAEMYDERGLQFVRWHKIAINASFNPSSVLSNGASNSGMAADPLLKVHIVGTMNEVLRLAEKVLQSPLPSKFATPEQIIKSTLRNTSMSEGEASRPSMWYDWAGGKPLELEVILGNVVREAERVSIEIPRVQSMYALLYMAQTRRDDAQKKAKL